MINLTLFAKQYTQWFSKHYTHLYTLHTLHILNTLTEITTPSNQLVSNSHQVCKHLFSKLYTHQSGLGALWKAAGNYIITVFHNCLNTFPDRLPHFLKTLNTNLKTHTQKAKSYTFAKEHFSLKTLLTLH